MWRVKKRHNLVAKGACHRATCCSWGFCNGRLRTCQWQAVIGASLSLSFCFPTVEVVSAVAEWLHRMAVSLTMLQSWHHLAQSHRVHLHTEQ